MYIQRISSSSFFFLSFLSFAWYACLCNLNPLNRYIYRPSFGQHTKNITRVQSRLGFCQLLHSLNKLVYELLSISTGVANKVREGSCEKNGNYKSCFLKIWNVIYTLLSNLTCHFGTPQYYWRLHFFYWLLLWHKIDISLLITRPHSFILDIVFWKSLILFKLSLTSFPIR